MEEKIPALGVTAYALMAAGGDLGASLAPQAVGIVVDKVTVTPWADTMAKTLFLSPEQIGFKVGMLAAALPPILGIFLLLYMKYYFKKQSNSIK